MDKNLDYNPEDDRSSISDYMETISFRQPYDWYIMDETALYLRNYA
ncbi:MAG: hypothetical protein GX375_05165 [Clostridiales bacterium]|nr:hypothetical protein [Clostridiales bacterium]